jgi:GTP cyclohydrolase I
MTLHGVKAQGSTTTTSAHTGLIRIDQGTRSESLALAIGNPRG